MMKKNIFVTVMILVLALIMSLTTAVAAFADTTGQSSNPGGGQFQNMMQNELIQALATASGETTAQIQQDLTNQTLPQLAQQLAQAGTITKDSLTTAILQTSANDQAQTLISGQTTGWQGNSGQSGSAPSSGQSWQGNGQNGGSGNRQAQLIQDLATASGQTTTQIQQDITNGQTPTQIAQQLAQAGTITQDSLAAAILASMTSDEQTRASTEAQDLINGQMPGRQGGATPTSGAGKGIVLRIGSSKMYINGVAQDIDSNQTQPVIRNSHTFVPIASIIKALGGTSSWDAANQTVTISLNNTSITLTIGSTSATVNGVATPLDDTPFISSTGRTMLPLAFITKSLGHSAIWDAQAKSITIQ
jgi:SOS response regulatory protein OraA/RecX